MVIEQSYENSDMAEDDFEDFNRPSKRKSKSISFLTPCPEGEADLVTYQVKLLQDNPQLQKKAKRTPMIQTVRMSMVLPALAHRSAGRPLVNRCARLLA